jgi:hypothetical protein
MLGQCANRTSALAAAQAPAPASIEGRWVNPDHSVIIDIAPCSENLCGTVQWANAKAQQDAREHAPHLIGTQLLTDLKPKGAMWEGRLFVPDRNLHVEGRIEPKAPTSSRFRAARSASASRRCGRARKGRCRHRNKAWPFIRAQA